jgi:hypothetical protein
MNTSLRASRIGLACVALLAAVALTACGAASSGSGGGTAVTSPASSSGPAGSGGPSSAAAPGAGGAASSTPAAPATTASTSTVAVPSGGPVPLGFAATSVTFVSPEEAFVLGTAPCAKAPCTSILRTLDRGASWRGLPAPVVPLAAQPGVVAGPAVWGIRFANPWDGFVFGDGLWETTDGGERWTPAVSPAGPIESLEVIDGQVLAITGTCSPNFGCGDQTGTLMRRPLAGGAWTVVSRVSGRGAIATQARVAAVLDGDGVLVTANGGISTVSHAGPCSTAGIEAPVSLAVTGPDGLALLCGGDGAAGSVDKTVFVSDDLGVHWSVAGSPARGGDPEEMSAGSASQLVVAAASGASMLYYSADGGARWSTAYYAGDGGLGFNDLGFTTPADGVVVYGPALSDNNGGSRPGWLLLTSNGGASWHPVPF